MKNFPLNKVTSYKILTYLGAVPFLLAALLAMFGFEALARKISLTYGAIIIAFMSGILWAAAIFSSHFSENLRDNFSKKLCFRLLFSSNILAILAFFVALFCLNIFGIFVEISCFLALVFIEFLLQKNQKIFSQEYFKMRLKITAVVVLCLGLIMFFS